MKTKFLLMLIAVFFLIGKTVTAQTDTIALWNFEDAAKRALIIDNASFGTFPYTADEGIVANKDIAIITKTGPNFTAWVTGAGGTGNFAPNSNTWNGGANSFFWQVTISTVGYENIQLSSKQMSSNTGPRDFQIEYSTDGILWTAVGPPVISLNDVFTSGTVSGLALPAACNNQPALSIRWLMTSETAVNNSPVGSNGTSRIDDILIKGSTGVFGNDATLAPNAFIFNIDQPQQLSSTITWNDANVVTLVRNLNIPPDTLVNGSQYILDADTVRILVPYLNSQYTSVGQQHLIQVQFDIGNPAVISVTWDNDSVYGAAIMPEIADFDLSNPGDVNTTITWNDAGSLVQITDNQATPYVLQPSDYSLAGNTLTINQSYIAPLLTAPGMNLSLTLQFDIGNDVVFTIQSMMSPPAPDVIALWDFENQTKRDAITDSLTFMTNPYTADDGIPSNINISSVKLFGGNKFAGWVAGAGTGSTAPNSNGWLNGENTKYWQIELNTEGYGNLNLSSKQRSSAFGPANFIVEYSVNGIDWDIVPGSAIACAENFTSGILNELPLPAECSNRTTLLLRWLMSSNTAVNTSPVSSTGTNRIEDIVVKGNFIVDEADIVEFSFQEQTSPAVIDPVLQTIDIEVLYGTNLTDLVAWFVLSPNATAAVNGVPQISGDTDNDFSSTVEYLITAGDGITTKLWSVNVNEGDPSSEAEILDFVILGHTNYNLNINSANATVELDIFNFNLTGLIAEFELSVGAMAEIAGVLQESGVTANDFTNPVVYTIIAQDGTTEKDWNVIVTGYVNNIHQSVMPDINVFPNPSSGVFMIDLPADGFVDVYSHSGQKVFSALLKTGQHIISVDRASSGNYFLRFSSGQRCQTRPIVIQK
jgi:hypothetical protein